MLGVNSLQKTISKLRADAESKRKLAQSMHQSAETHIHSGDDVRAQHDRDAAERYEHEADDSEHKAGIYEMDVMRRQHKAHTIEKQIEDLKHNFEKELAHLERERDSILG